MPSRLAPSSKAQFSRRAAGVPSAAALALALALAGAFILLGTGLGTIELGPLAAGLIAIVSLLAAAVAYSTSRAFVVLQNAGRQMAIALADAQAQAKQAAKDYERLRDAFDVLPEPVILFDADDRVVFWNKLYAKHSSLAAGHGDGSLRPGITFTELMRANMAKGRFPAAEGREQEWLAERLALHTQAINTYEQRLADDQWVRIEERRTPEGGNISVRVDITDLKQREASVPPAVRREPGADVRV